MNIRSKFLCIFSVVAIASLPATANECSSVTFVNDIHSNKVVELLAVDANFIETLIDEKQQAFEGTTLPYYFKAGEYSLLVRVWDRNFYLYPDL